jgi:hypothetical protein
MITDTKSRPLSESPPIGFYRSTAARDSAARVHCYWLAAGLALAFAIPFVFADVLTVPRDSYYAIYVVSVAVFLALWGRQTGQDVHAALRRNWRWAITLGVVFAALMAFVVVRDAPTAHPARLDVLRGSSLARHCLRSRRRAAALELPDFGDARGLLEEAAR